MSRVVVVYAIGLLALTLLGIVAVPLYEKKVTDTLQAEATQLLHKNGMTWASATADGRDLTLSGIAPTQDDHQRMLTVMGDLYGEKVIIDQTSNRIVRPYILTLAFRDQQLTAEGLFPSKKHLESFKQVVGTGKHYHAIVDDIKVASGAPKQWNELIHTLVQAMIGFEYLDIDLVDQSVFLAGKAISSETKKNLINQIGLFKQAGYQFDINIISPDTIAQRCQNQFDVLLTQSIAFQSGKARINPSSFGLLEDLTETALLCPAVDIIVAGHTDNRGNEAKNKALSKERADAVAKWIVSAGVKEERITTVGLGSSEPVASNDTEKGRAKNRRIEFIVQEK